MIMLITLYILCTEKSSDIFIFRFQGGVLKPKQNVMHDSLQELFLQFSPNQCSTVWLISPRQPRTEYLPPKLLLLLHPGAAPLAEKRTRGYLAGQAERGHLEGRGHTQGTLRPKGRQLGAVHYGTWERRKKNRDKVNKDMNLRGK